MSTSPLKLLNLTRSKHKNLDRKWPFPFCNGRRLLPNFLAILNKPSHLSFPSLSFVSALCFRPKNWIFLCREREDVHDEAQRAFGKGEAEEA